MKETETITNRLKEIIDMVYKRILGNGLPCVATEWVPSKRKIGGRPRKS